MPTKKKPAAKKKAAKKTVRKSSKKSKKDLVHADSDQCFWVTDGTVLANLCELSEALDQMSEDIFGYHVTREKNDFADWIEDVLQDVELATKLRKSKKPNTARKVVVSRLRIYSI